MYILLSTMDSNKELICNIYIYKLQIKNFVFLYFQRNLVSLQKKKITRWDAQYV